MLVGKRGVVQVYAGIPQISEVTLGQLLVLRWQVISVGSLRMVVRVSGRGAP